MSLFQLRGRPITVQALDIEIGNLEKQITAKSEEIAQLQADLPARVIEEGANRPAAVLESVEREHRALIRTRAELERKRTALENAELAEAAKLDLALKAELGAKAAAIATRLEATLDDAAAGFAELVSILDRFTQAPPHRGNDYPPIASLAALRLWAKTGGLVGRGGMVGPSELLANDRASLVHAVREFIEMAIAVPAAKPSSIPDEQRAQAQGE